MSLQGVDYEARCMKLEQDVLRQIAIAAELKTENERLRAAMLKMQEDDYPQVCCGYEEDGECLWCGAYPRASGEDHAPDCPWLVVESVKGRDK